MQRLCIAWVVAYSTVVTAGARRLPGLARLEMVDLGGQAISHDGLEKSFLTQVQNDQARDSRTFPDGSDPCPFDLVVGAQALGLTRGLGATTATNILTGSENALFFHIYEHYIRQRHAL